MKTTLKTSFWQLFTIYALLILALATGFLWKYSLHMNIFAVLIALIGVYALSQGKTKEKLMPSKIYYAILIVLMLLIIILRIIPYMSNTVPLGYDSGIYKYGIEHGLENLDNWILRGGLEPGFLYLITALHIFFSSDFLLVYGLVVFSLLLGLTVYLVVKEHSKKQTALFALALFTLSAIQFKTFWFMYYKNIIGMSLMLLAFYFLKKSENDRKWLGVFVLAGGLVGSVHRPSFYIFGLSYFIWAFVSPYSKKYDWNKLKFHALAGIGVLLVAASFYLGKFRQAWLVMFEPVLQGFAQPGESAGTFINFFTFQFFILPYLILALIGLFLFIKKKDFNILTIWCVVNLAIVYFQFFFFNRFIIFLDLAFVIMAAFGASAVWNEKGNIGKAIILVLLLSASVLVVQESVNSRPLVTEAELATIQKLNMTEENASAMSTSKYYSPWILGYSQRRTIAPGLFDYDNHTLEEWKVFWAMENLTEMKEFMSTYEKPVYAYIGTIQEDNLAQFPQCFKIYSDSEGGKIYKYIC